jgi:hypothetical protein
MSHEETTLKLNLDAKQFVEAAHHAKESIGSIAEAEGLNELVEKLAHASKLIGVLGAAALVAKLAFDFTLEAEQIQKIERQFETLAHNVDLSAHAVKEGLVKAVGGLADETDVLEAANRAMVQLGDNSGRMVEFMELARKITPVMGGTLIENFEKISQAVGTGNARLLRSIGLNVDAEKAMTAYAKATNQTVAALTENERKQALANAVLEKGQKILSGSTAQAETATTTLKKIGVEFKDLGEAIALLFERVFGSTVRSVLKKFQESLHGAKEAFKGTFGTEAEQASARVKDLSAKMQQWEKDIARIHFLQEKSVSFKSAEKQAELNKSLDFYTSKIKEAQVEIDKLKGKEEAHVEAGTEAAGAKAVKISSAEATQKLIVQKKFEQDIIALRESTLKEEERVATSLTEIQEKQLEIRTAMIEKANAQIAMITAQGELGKELTVTQAADRVLEIEKTLMAQLELLDQQRRDTQLKNLQQVAQKNAYTAAGISAGFKAAAAEASKNVGNFAKLGEVAFSSLKKNGKNAFMALGEGAESAGDIMRGFMFNAIADIAEAQGEEFMAAGFTNPAMFAAGGALLALAGFLRSQSKGSSAMSGAPGGGGGAGGGAAASLAGPDQTSLVEADKKPKREVTIQIQGHYLDTEGSRRALMEMIRTETDATAFRYVEIGQGA